jgi:hypothetical protein
MKPIAGCNKTTPTTAAMEIEADLQPSRIRLQTKVLQTITRMESLSAKHPLQKSLASAMRVRTASTTHQSNLENILQQFPYRAENIERIETHIRPPWWIPKIETQSAQQKTAPKSYIIRYKCNSGVNIHGRFWH